MRGLEFNHFLDSDIKELIYYNENIFDIYIETIVFNGRVFSTRKNGKEN